MTGFISRVLSNALNWFTRDVTELSSLHVPEGERIVHAGGAFQGAWLFLRPGELVWTEKRLYFRPRESRYAKWRTPSVAVAALDQITRLSWKPQSALESRWDA